MDAWHGGVVRRSELTAAGVTRRELEAMIRGGALIPVREAWYARPGLGPEAMYAVRAGVRVGCITAARLHGLWIPPGAETGLHFVGHAHTSLAVRHGVLHHPENEPPLYRCADRILTGAVEAIAQLCRCVPVQTAWVIVESALEKRRITPWEWNRILAGLPARRRVALAPAAALSGSGTESEFIRRLRMLGIGFRQQVRIGEDRVDVLLDDGTVVELDSRGYHDAAADARRDARLSAAGHDVLRFYYDQVWFEWPLVQAALLAARDRRRVARIKGRR